MKTTRLFCFALMFLGAQLTIGQNAQDFTVVDSDGQTHTLYADYLDQGKTVLVKIFFTTCPPCIQIAPFMEDFYQEWGAGEEDVEFFELSDKFADTDNKITTYKNLYGMTFPSVGSDGGSIEAVAPYKAGDYGQFTGTPTFVVIAPDGSVQFDVFGPGIEGQFDALDEALMATGAMKPDTMVIDTMDVDTMDIDTMMIDTTTQIPTTIGGQIMFQSGSTPVSNVIVELFATMEEGSDLLYSDTSDNQGIIDLSFFEDSISTDAVIRARKEGAAGNGLTGIDLIRIQRHLLNIQPFDQGIQFLLSDANSTNSLSALDLVDFQKIILSIKDEFTSGPSWYLIPASVTLPLNGSNVPLNYRDYIRLADLIDESETLQFNAYKRGDLNGSANPNE